LASGCALNHGTARSPLPAVRARNWSSPRPGLAADIYEYGQVKAGPTEILLEGFLIS
jgi:hypothetical protein